MSSETYSPISPRPRINAVAQYMLALACVIGAYSAYVSYAVPLIEGPPNLIKKRTATPIADLPTPREQKSHLAHLLPADAWEMKDCKKLIIDAGTILFDQIEQQPDGSLKVVPFTLITGLADEDLPTDGKPKTPTVLRCLTGSFLKFNKPIQEVFRGGAKLESARLVGHVDVYRPPSQAGVNDALHLVTSDVHIDKRRIYTLEEVQFSYGPNQGRGRNMSIDLSHEGELSTIADFSNVNGIRRMELAFLDRLRIEPPPKDALQAAKSPTVGPNKKQLFESKSPFEISCRGAFVFDFRSLTATFQDKVVAWQDDEFRDQIECEKLTLNFAEKIAKDDPTAQPILPTIEPAEESDSQFNSDMELRQFVAEGFPAVIVSRSKSTKVSGSFILYDMASRQFIGRGDPSSNSNVMIVSPKHQIVAQQLKYIIPDDDALGEITATGAGQMLNIGSNEKDEFFTTWKNSLTTRRVPEQPGLHQIVIDGSAKIRIDDQTRIDADRIDFLVWQIPKLTRDNNKKTKTEWEYQPSKLFTTGDVTIESPKLDGQAQHLTATWPEFQNTTSALNIRDHRTGYRGTILLQSNQSSQNWIQNDKYTRLSNQPANRTAPLRSTATQSRQPSGFVEQNAIQNSTQNIRRDPNLTVASFQEIQAGLTPKSPPRKLKFKGETVDVRLMNVKDKTEIRDLTVVGNVTIVDQPKPGETPLTIVGHRLQLTPQAGKDNYRTLITGKNEKMAKVTAKNLILEGQSINLDQVDNKVWVEGGGTMNLKMDPKTDALRTEVTKQAGQGSNGKVTPDNLDVSWQGGMIFDGAKVYFERNVVMRADQPAKDGAKSKLQSLSQGLSIELTAPISFQNLESDGTKPDVSVREMVLVQYVPEHKQVFKMVGNVAANPNPSIQPVVIENQTFDFTGKLIERQKFVVPQAVINAEANSIKSSGPGTIATHRYKTPSDSKPGQQAQSNPFGRLSGKGNASGISFIQINFDGELSIDGEKNEMLLKRNVRTVFSPVPNWDSTFNPDTPQRRVPGTVFLTCEQLQLAQWSPRGTTEKSNELIATGNAHILGDALEATADRVSYSQSSDLLIVSGSPRNDANLWAKGAHLVAEKITYRVSDQSWTTDGVKNMNIKK